MLKIIQSPDMGRLAQRFFEIYRQYRQGVFDTTQVIVPNLAVADWLQQRLAQQSGIAARLQFPLWREFLHQAQEDYYRLRHPQQSLPLPLSLPGMRWLLFAYLLNEGQAIMDDAAHPLQQPLESLFNGLTAEEALSEAQVQRLWAYAGETAKIFNDYLSMRPDWLQAFAAASAPPLEALVPADTLAAMPDWLQGHYRQVLAAQAFIWRHLFAEQAAGQARLRQAFIAAAEAGELPAQIVPAQLFVFMAEDMDAQMLRSLQALGGAREVYVFHHSVSNAYMADIVDSRWLCRLPGAARDSGHYSSGHELFSRFGKEMRRRFRLLEAAQLLDSIEYLDAPADSSRLLGQLQNDIRRLDDSLSLRPPAADDDSLRIHGCHGLLRQLEVLRGEIVRWLNADSSRHIDDILLLLPDVGAHQDALRSVFPPAGDYDGYTLPARLTGVSTVAVDNLWQALGGIYALAESDFSFPEVKQWLLLPDNCAAYGLSHEEMLQCLAALAEAGFRRGFDEAHLAQLADDGDSRFSFCYALDRLISGYAMPATALYAGRVVPYAPLPGEALPALDALCRFAQDIRSIRARRGERIEATAGLERLRDRLQTQYAHAADGAAYQAIDKHIRNVIYQLVGSHAALSRLPPLPFAFIVRTVAQSLGGMQLSAEPGGVITLGQLHSLQSLPHRLIVFLGAENGSFPTQTQDRRYNLIDIAPRADDRSHKDGDLAAFLNALCAARDACWLFYTAVDPVDKEERLPPAPVQEVLDYLQHSLPEARIHFRHSPDPFQPNADSPSHPAPLWQHLQQRLAHNSAKPARPWADWSAWDFSAPPPQPAQAAAALSLPFERIIHELSKPLHSYLRRQGIVLGRQAAADAAREPLFADHLQQWALREALIRQPDAQAEIVQALPLLPVGRVGQAQYAQTRRRIEARRRRLMQAAGMADMPPLNMHDIALAGINISAALPACPTQAWLRLLPGRAQGKTYAEAWLWHLLWQSSADLALEDKGGSYVNFHDDDAEEGLSLYFEPIAQRQAQDMLQDWLALYRSLGERPWLWTPQAALAACKEEEKTLKTMLAAAYLPADRDEQQAWAFLFGAADAAPLADALRHSLPCAQALYRPLAEILAAHDLPDLKP